MRLKNRSLNDSLPPERSHTTIWRIGLVVYAILLLISTAIRFMLPAEAAPAEGQRYVLLDPSESGAAVSAKPVKIAYIQRFSQSKPARSTILLVHGSPMAAGPTFSDLIPRLSRSMQVIAPDLPGFGASTRHLPDYSINTHARYLLALMDRLGIDDAHIVAYSMGGGVALNMAHLAPERIRSLTMLSAIGVQEFELLGQYHMNRAIHGIQLALIWSVTNLVPHMGLLDPFPLNIPYARNFYDSDQRPLRGYLSAFESPMLILHGKKDLLVPLSAAVEHKRLVPQSRLSMHADGHLLLFNQTGSVAEEINRFIGEVEADRAVTRSGAGADRVTAAERPFNRSAVPPAEGLALIILMLLIALATLISEDLTCIGAGLMVARGSIEFVPALTAAYIGIFGGDILLYLAGRYLGRPAIQYPPFKWFLKEDDLARTSRWFNIRGPVIILASRFLPGSRLPTYFGAGVLGTGFWLFLLYFSIAAALWTPILVGTATLIGQQVISVYEVWHRYALLATLASLASIWIVIRIIFPLFTYRGRRLLWSGWLRKTHWEFWPPVLFYPPVVIYVILIGLLRRGLTLFTVTNPGIPESGFVGESKSRILDSLKIDRDRIARYRLIPGELAPASRTGMATAFMRSLGSGYPVVLKPDVGQRGQGVTVIHTREQLESYLWSATGDTIIQEYIDGLEYGIFYYRMPGENKGRIFSITDKRLLTLIGDGKSTLEHLILSDKRAVCMAPYHFKQHAGDLYRVPAANELVRLVEVGTHARGALFLDGISILTESMRAAIDRVSRGFAGFYFGRYDIRTPSLDDFKAGKNFKILELNGVTSEATHIYNPGNSLWKAYGVLMRQWRLAIDIGAANKKRGAVPLTKMAFLKLVFRHQLARNPAGNASDQTQKAASLGEES